MNRKSDLEYAVDSAPNALRSANPASALRGSAPPRELSHSL